MIQYLLLFSILAASSKENSALDCSEFKTGIFVMLDEAKNETSTIIKRDEEFQSWEDKNNEESEDWHIVWEDECIYYIMPVDKHKSEEQRKQDEQSIFYRRYFEIIEVDGAMYRYKSYFKGTNHLTTYGWVKRID